MRRWFLSEPSELYMRPHPGMGQGRFLSNFEGFLGLALLPLAFEATLEVLGGFDTAAACDADADESDNCASDPPPMLAWSAMMSFFFFFVSPLVQIPAFYLSGDTETRPPTPSRKKLILLPCPSLCAESEFGC